MFIRFVYAQCNLPSVCAAAPFKQCADVKAVVPKPETGIFRIKPNSQRPSFEVFCDFTETDIAWTKILHIAKPYKIFVGGFGNTAMNSTFVQSAKLSDAQINSIASSLSVWSRKKVFYRITAADTTLKVYTQSPASFDDLATAWGIFSVNRSECLSVSFRSCSWVNSTYPTLDTLNDGVNSDDQTQRFFTDNAGHRRCYHPHSPNRCVSGGWSIGHGARDGVELWVG